MTKFGLTTHDIKLPPEKPDNIFDRWQNESLLTMLIAERISSPFNDKIMDSCQLLKNPSCDRFCFMAIKFQPTNQLVTFIY